MTDVIPHVLIAPKNKLIDFPGHVNIFDDQGFGFDYQEHLIRKVFNEIGSDIYLYLIYEDFKKSAGYAETNIYPRDSAEGLKTKTVIPTDKMNKHQRRKKGLKPGSGGSIYKNCHWEPFLQFYTKNKFWKIEYEKYIKTLEHYKKAFYSFTYCHIQDQELIRNLL